MPGGGRWETSREPSIDTEEGRHCKHSNYAGRDFPFFRRVINAKFHGFCPSESSDERKMRKMTFPPRRKCGNRQNLCFRRGKYRHGKRRKACEPLRLLKTLPVLEKYIRNRLITIACFFSFLRVISGRYQLFFL